MIPSNAHKVMADIFPVFVAMMTFFALFAIVIGWNLD